MTVSDWEPLVTSLIVSGAIGVPGLIILTVGTRQPRKANLLNVFG